MTHLPMIFCHTGDLKTYELTRRGVKYLFVHPKAINHTENISIEFLLLNELQKGITCRAFCKGLVGLLTLLL